MNANNSSKNLYETSDKKYQDPTCGPIKENLYNQNSSDELDVGEGYLTNDISKKFDNLTNLEDNMRKLNQVLETSIKSSYRTRYEYNLNDYKKNFQTETLKDHDSVDAVDDLESEKNSKKIVENFDEDENVILSKRFFAEKNTNVAKKPTAHKASLTDKSDNYQNTLNLKNKQNNIAEFEEVERVSPKKTELKNNVVKNNVDFYQQKSLNNANYSNSNLNPHNNIGNTYNDDNFQNLNNLGAPNNNIYKTYNSANNLNRKTIQPINNFAQLNHQFESFNLDDVLKTADNLSKNKKGVEVVNNKRVEIAQKVYDIQKLKKINTPNPNENGNFNNINDDSIQNNFYSTADKNYNEYDNYNTYSDTNFTNNNSKKEVDEFDYLKNLLMKTQMQIQNFNKEFDNDTDIKEFNRDNARKNNYSTEYQHQHDKIYILDSAKDTIPRKQPKPTKPVI